MVTYGNQAYYTERILVGTGVSEEFRGLQPNNTT